MCTGGINYWAFVQPLKTETSTSNGNSDSTNPARGSLKRNSKQAEVVSKQSATSNEVVGLTLEMSPYEANQPPQNRSKCKDVHNYLTYWKI